MYYSITFTNSSGAHKNTWDDWYLIPSTRPTIAEPTLSNKFVDVPGRNGSIDISDFLTGSTVYGDRSGSFDFYVSNDKNVNWKTIKSSIETFLHGKKIKMEFEDDPGWYYEGRFTFKEWKSEPQFSKVTIEYRVGPYKTNKTSGVTSL